MGGVLCNKIDIFSTMVFARDTGVCARACACARPPACTHACKWVFLVSTLYQKVAESLTLDLVKLKAFLRGAEQI